MKIFMMISWRNLWRNKRRSFVVIGSVAIGIVGMMLSMAFMNSMTIQMIDNTINTSMGHIAIHKKGFQDTRKLEYNFLPAKGQLNILETLQKEKRIKAYAQRVKVQGMVRSSETARSVMLVGIDHQQEKNVSRIDDYTLKTNGSAFLTDDDKDMVLVSKSMAEKLQVGIGDKIVVMLQDKKNKINAEGLVVQGVFHTPIESFDKYTVFVGIKKLQQIVGLEQNISEINILTSDKQNVDNIKADICSRLQRKDLEVLSWKDMAPQLVSAVRLFDSTMYVFFAIIFITVVFSITNTLIMAIMERFHEIGVMKSIGTRPSHIFFMILFEAISLGVVGLVAGILVSFIFIGYWSMSGLDLSFYMESMRALGTGSVLYPFLRVKDFAASIIIVLVTTILAALYPALKAARIKPLEALTYI